MTIKDTDIFNDDILVITSERRVGLVRNQFLVENPKATVYTLYELMDALVGKSSYKNFELITSFDAEDYISEIFQSMKDKMDVNTMSYKQMAAIEKAIGFCFIHDVSEEELAAHKETKTLAEYFHQFKHNTKERDCKLTVEYVCRHLTPKKMDRKLSTRYVYVDSTDNYDALMAFLENFKEELVRVDFSDGVHAENIVLENVV